MSRQTRMGILVVLMVTYAMFAVWVVGEAIGALVRAIL